jgi:hypothetical protein
VAKKVTIRMEADMVAELPAPVLTSAREIGLHLAG